MALTEAQIQRYSRQILLAPVGGLGQERLLACGAVRVSGSGPVFSTAAAYLAASGVATSFDGPPDEPGFLSGREGAVAELNPDAGRSAPVFGVVGRRDDTSEALHRVLVHPAAIYFSAAGQPGGHPSGDEPLPGGAEGVLLGSLVAGVMQRLILGLGVRRGALLRDSEGGWSHVP